MHLAFHLLEMLAETHVKQTGVTPTTLRLSSSDYARLVEAAGQQAGRDVPAVETVNTAAGELRVVVDDGARFPIVE